MRTIKSVLMALLCLQMLSAQTGVPSDRNALLQGEGMGLAGYAEANGFPGPKHVLDLKDTLQLTREQLRITEALVARVKDRARKLGEQIVGREEELNRLFAAKHSVGEEPLKALLKEIAGLHSDLRFVHLQAHLEMSAALTRDQHQRYAVLRGQKGPHVR